jgi:5-methylcytosine-specific restriction endonuclease McrA
MDERKNITTTARQAIWEAHAKKCAYTGAPIDWSELEIDHIIPLNGDPARKADLQSKGIIESSGRAARRAWFHVSPIAE